MATCGKLSSNAISSACGFAPVGGTTSSVYIINFEDIDRVATDVEGNVVSALSLVTGAKAYEFVSKDNATTGSATYNRGTYFNTLDHSVTIRAFIRNQQTKDFVAQLNGARVVVVIENINGNAFSVSADGTMTNDASQSVKYEIWGFDAGLTLSELPYSTELSDSTYFSATLSTDENNKEGDMPKTYNVGTESGTKQQLRAMLSNT